MRSFLRDIFLTIGGHFAKPQNGIHILNGHFADRYNPTSDVFLELLAGLNKSVRFIKFETAVQLIVTKTKVDEPLVAFSFDDGFEECYTILAPALEKFDCNAAFFINPNFVDGNQAYIQNFTNNVVLTMGKNPMTWSQIQELHKRGHVIGSHTMDHDRLSTTKIDELAYQLGNSKAIIEQKIGSKCNHFAFPYGRIEDINQASLAVAERYYATIFSQSDYKNYFSFGGKVINRRHFEPNWKLTHVKYFLNTNKKWN